MAVSSRDWLGALLGLCILCPLWTASPALPMVCIGLLLSGRILSAILLLTIVAALNAVTFERSPRFLRFILGLDVSKYYRACGLRGRALSTMSREGTLHCFHPHGILASGFSVNGCWSADFNRRTAPLASGADRTAPAAGGAESDEPAIDGTKLFGGTVFLISRALRAASGPFKVMCDASGRIESATKENFNALMGARRNLAIIPGGFEEATLYARGTHRVYIRRRKGFVKYALQHGYKLQPIYTFGEADTYTAFTGLLRLRLWINTLGMPAVLFWGAHFFPLLPRTASRVLSYVGEPIQMPKIPHPTSEELDTWHGRYVDALVRTFEENKAEAGYPNATLELW